MTSIEHDSRCVSLRSDRLQTRIRAALGSATLLFAAAFGTDTAAAERLVDVALIESGPAVITAETLVVENGATAVSATKASRIVASLTLGTGAALEFIDAGDGYIDIAERTAEGLPFVTHQMTTRWNATPLEIFKALAPDQPVPNALFTDHNRRGQGAEQPRDLTSASSTLSLDDPGFEPYVCDPFFVADNWVDDWNTAFAAITTYSAAAYLHHFPKYTFYPGAAVYYGTGTNRKTYLGACNASSDQDVTLSIDRWVVVDFSPVTWGWGEIHEVIVEDGEKYTYYSGHPNGRYRGRVEGPGEPVFHQGVAAAWTPSLPLGYGTP